MFRKQEEVESQSAEEMSTQQVEVIEIEPQVESPNPPAKKKKASGKMLDECIFTEKLRKIKGLNHILEKYNFVAKDINPFIEEKQAQLAQNYTEIGRDGVERQRVLNCRVPNDKQSVSQMNLRRRESLFKLQRKNKESP